MKKVNSLANEPINENNHKNNHHAAVLSKKCMPRRFESDLLPDNM